MYSNKSGKKKGEKAEDPLSGEGQFIIAAAFRYCLGRHSYAPGLFQRWAKENWRCIGEGNRALFMKEILQEVQESLSGDVDADGWARFRNFVGTNRYEDLPKTP